MIKYPRVRFDGQVICIIQRMTRLWLGLEPPRVLNTVQTLRVSRIKSFDVFSHTRHVDWIPSVMWHSNILLMNKSKDSNSMLDFDRLDCQVPYLSRMAVHNWSQEFRFRFVTFSFWYSKMRQPHLVTKLNYPISPLIDKQEKEKNKRKKKGSGRIKSSRSLTSRRKSSPGNSIKWLLPVAAGPLSVLSSPRTRARHSSFEYKKKENKRRKGERGKCVNRNRLCHCFCGLLSTGKLFACSLRFWLRLSPLPLNWFKCAATRSTPLCVTVGWPSVYLWQ